MINKIIIGKTELEVSDDGEMFKNSKTGKIYNIYTNKNRSNRRRVSINGKNIFCNIIVAKAFPEICGEWFDGCEVHHIDGDTTNDSAYNLIVLTHSQHLEIHKDFLGIWAKENLSIPVHQYTLDGDYVTTYSSSIEAGKSINIATSAIRNCLCGINQSAGGYMWIHSDTSEPPSHINGVGTLKERFRKANGKQITNGEKIFDSITEAAEYYNTIPSNINNVLKGRSKTAVGYKWEYIN